MSEKFASELMDAFKGQGSTVKKREDAHRWLRQTGPLLIIDGNKQWLVQYIIIL
jgi:hypothetical protein